MLVDKERQVSSDYVNRCKPLHNLKQNYEYNGVIRTLMESYLSLNFSALMNISKVHGV